MLAVRDGEGRTCQQDLPVDRLPEGDRSSTSLEASTMELHYSGQCLHTSKPSLLPSGELFLPPVKLRMYGFESAFDTHWVFIARNRLATSCFVASSELYAKCTICMMAMVV